MAGPRHLEIAGIPADDRANEAALRTENYICKFFVGRKNAVRHEKGGWVAPERGIDLSERAGPEYGSQSQQRNYAKLAVSSLSDRSGQKEPR